MKLCVKLEEGGREMEGGRRGKKGEGEERGGGGRERERGKREKGEGEGREYRERRVYRKIFRPLIHFLSCVYKRVS